MRAASLRTASEAGNPAVRVSPNAGLRYVSSNGVDREVMRVGLVIVSRPPRRIAPAIPTGEVVLEPPPEIPNAAGKGWSRMLMIMPMAAGAAAMGLMMGVQRGGPLAYVAGGMYGVSTLGMIAAQVAGQAGGQSKRDMIDARRQYMRRLSQLRAQVRTTIRQQREAIFYRHPDPQSLWSTQRQRAAVGAAPIRSGFRCCTHRPWPARTRDPADPAADPAGRRTRAAVRGGTAPIRVHLLGRSGLAGRDRAARLHARLPTGTGRCRT